jgi:sterol desaturase/sphingolipid hydroxylase (fatty acid hydroxylase superfamily)
MKQNLASWFTKLLERDFPVRKPRSTALARRAGMLLLVIGACVVGVVLVAFALVAIEGQFDKFFFIAALMVGGGSRYRRRDVPRAMGHECHR